MSDLTRLDIETKVALMAALVYNEDAEDAYGTAVHRAVMLEREAHRQVTEQISEKRKSVGG